MGDLSRNFDSSEFMCHCGCRQLHINKNLVYMSQAVRDYFDLPVSVHCVNRCLKHNRYIYEHVLKLPPKRGDTSKHIPGLAMDFHVSGISVKEQHKEIKYLMSVDNTMLVGGVGFYPWGNHIDVGNKRQWGIPLC